MQKFTERERISLLMMRGWNDYQKSYKEMGLLFNPFRTKCRKIQVDI